MKRIAWQTSLPAKRAGRLSFVTSVKPTVVGGPIVDCHVGIHNRGGEICLSQMCGSGTQTVVFLCPPKTSSRPVVSPRQVRPSPRLCVFFGSDRPPHQRAFSFLPSTTPSLSISWIQFLGLSLRPWAAKQGFLPLKAYESCRAERGRLPLDTFA
jgi:hypothetical protein